MASAPSEPQPALFLAILLICPSGEDMSLVLAPSVVPGSLAGAPGGRGGACGAEAPGPRAAGQGAARPAAPGGGRLEQVEKVLTQQTTATEQPAGRRRLLRHDQGLSPCRARVVALSSW